MKRIVLPLVAFLCGCNANQAILDADFHPTNRGWGTPVWRDEFNGNAIDPANWVVAQFCGGYNGEQQCYTNRSDNVRVMGGHLVITAWREEAPHACDGDDIRAVTNEVGVVTCPPTDAAKPDYRYSSGRLHTRVSGPGGPNAWTHGRIEIRATLPYGKGTWPAFWMLPLNTGEGWPISGEIDIMEAVNLSRFVPAGFKPGDSIQSNLHLCSDNPYFPVDPFASETAKESCADLGGTFAKVHRPMSLQMGNYPGRVPNLTGAFHTYAMEWSDVDMRFFVDDKIVGETFHGPDSNSRAPFRHPFFLIINLAIGGAMPGTPDRNTWMTTYRTSPLLIDWVRVYACGGDPTARNCIWRGQGLGKAP